MMAERVVELVSEAGGVFSETGEFWNLVDRLFDREDRDPVRWRIREVVTSLLGMIEGC